MQQRIIDQVLLMEMTWIFLPFYFMKKLNFLFILLSMLILYLKVVHAKISFWKCYKILYAL